MAGQMIKQSTRVVADIGGTNARFAFVKNSSDELLGIEKFPCADFPLFVDAVRAYMDRGHVENVDQICLAIAGPVEDDLIDLPNNHWVFSRRELEVALGVSVHIINDFSAQVLSIGSIRDEELRWIGLGRPDYSAPGVIAVLGPGTGLGVSAMLSSGEIIPSEAGHIGFAPQDRHESALLNELWHRYERVSVERLLSGMGLANLYWANGRLDGLEKELSAPGITAGALAGDRLCLKAVKDFCAILGSVAGDVALMMGANSGVYLSGGILPLMQELIDEDLLRQRFNAKGRFSEICSRIPLGIVMAEHPGLRGCVRALRSL